MKKINLNLLIYLIAIVILSSCVKDTYDLNKLSKKVDVNFGLAIPLAYGEIFIGDLLKFEDTTLMKKVNDSIIIVINMDTLMNMNVDDIISIGGDDIGEGVTSDYKIGANTLEDVNFTKAIGLGELAGNLNSSEEAALIASEGTNWFPDVPAQDGGTYPADSSDKYLYMTFSEGKIVININNGYPAEITNITIRINDSCTENQLNFYDTSFVFNNVPPNSKVSDSVSIVGETMYNPINFIVSNIVIAGPQDVSPDTVSLDDVLEFNAQMKDLEIWGGSAKINRPEPLDSMEIQKIVIAGKEDIELTQLELSSGYLKYDVNNGIGEDMVIKFVFPHTFENADYTEIVKDSITVHPGEHIVDSLSLGGSYTDLTMGNTTYNSFPIKYFVKVDSTKEYVKFDSSNAIVYNFSFTEIDFRSITGYFGKDTTKQDSSISIDMAGGGGPLDKIEGGFKFSEPKLNITYFNSLSIPLGIDLKLSALVDNTLEVAGGDPRQIPIPTVVGESTSGALVYDKKDGLDNILSFPLADKINYKVNAITNMEKKTYDNFIVKGGRMYIGLNMEIPLALESAGFKYRDTMPFDRIPEGLEAQAAIGFTFVNEFPFNVKLEVVPWDSAGTGDTLPAVISTKLLEASLVNNDGVKTKATEFTTEIGVDSDDFVNMIAADHLIIIATVDTKDAFDKPQSVRIMDNYKISFKVNFKGAVKFNGNLSSIGGGDEEGNDK